MVRRTNKEREIITRINGEESVEIEIYKEADANIVNVAKRVSNIVFGTAEQQAFVRQLEERKKQAETEKTKAAPDEQKKKQTAGSGRDRGEEILKKQMTNFIAYGLPGGVEIAKLSDQSVFIENAVNEVKSTAVLGGILAIIVLFVFLRNFTMTIIVGISIPISVVATFAPASAVATDPTGIRSSCAPAVPTLLPLPAQSGRLRTRRDSKTKQIILVFMLPPLLSIC